MRLLDVFFWGSVAWITYVYLGYPFLLACIGRVYRRPVRRATIEPSVTIVIAAFNEEAHIAGTIRNKLDLDYPSSKLQIIVVSDGSSDRTDELARQFEKSGVRLIRQIPRQGKTAALNQAVAAANSELIVFSDANSMYERDALRRMVANFADPAVGYVTGKMVYVNADGSVVGDGCTAYMRYENALRSLESELGSVVGVDGGIDAVRRELFVPMRADQLPDFVLPLRVVQQGYRVVYEPAAVLRESVLNQVSDEFRMRVRVALRALWALWDMRVLLAPWCHGLFSWQLWSHKALRYLAFIPMFALAATSALLWTEAPLYRLAAIAQLAAYGLVLVGLWAPSWTSLQRLAALPSYFVLVNLASGLAFWRFLRGQKQVLWKPRTG